MLEDEGVIESAIQFRVLVELLGYDRLLQAGEYEFDSNTPALDVVYRMRRGIVSSLFVTVIEGWRLGEIADALDAQALVVGLALTLSGALGPQAQRAQALADALAGRLDIPVHTWDERLTSAEARHRLPRSARRASARKRRPKGDLDAMAAASILQAYLDSQRGPASE